jgi:hypothetical protein
MANSLAIEILQFEKKLKEAGFTEQQARIQTEFMADIIEDKLATKKDLLDTETKLRQEINQAKIELEYKIAELKAELIKWMLGVSTAQAAIIISCIKLIH